MTLEELNSNINNHYLPIVGIYPEKGYAMFIAHIFRIRYPNKPSEWFLYDCKTEEVKQICNY